jgi:hypothetical protein
MPDALLNRDALDGDGLADTDNLDLVMNNNLGGEQPVSLTRCAQFEHAVTRRGAASDPSARAGR